MIRTVLLACLLASCSGLRLLAAAVRAPLRIPATSNAAMSPRMLFGGGAKEGGGGGGMPNMMETIKQAQQMGVKVKELQEELMETEVEAVAADGGVIVVVTGAQDPVSVTVTDEMVAKGHEAVSEAVSAAAKEAHFNSVEYAKTRMTELYTELGLPAPPAA